MMIESVQAFLFLWNQGECCENKFGSQLSLIFFTHVFTLHVKTCMDFLEELDAGITTWWGGYFFSPVATRGNAEKKKYLCFFK